MGTAAYSALLKGGGIDSSTASVVILAGDATFFDQSLSYGSIRTTAGIADDGSFAFAADTTAPTNADEIIARWTPAAGFELVAREGVQAAGAPSGIGYGTEAGEVQIVNDRRAAFGMGGLTGGGGTALFLNAAIDDGLMLVRSGVTVPQQQEGGAQSPIFDTGSFRIDASGENYLYGAGVPGSGDVIVLNNTIIARRDLPLPDGNPGFFEQPDFFSEGLSLSPYNGHYAFRCPADFDGDWDHVVVVDGKVAAATDSPIVPGTSLVWRNGDNSNSPFLLNLVNSHGDYLVGGVAWLDQSHSHYALVYNGTTNLQYGGGVDMNGDGLPNDGYLAGAIRTDSAFLTDDGKLFFTAPLSNGFQFVGEAFMWIPVPRGGDINCDGQINFFDIDPFLLALFDQPAYTAAYPDCWPITADINRDGNVDFFDIDPFLECLFSTCP